MNGDKTDRQILQFQRGACCPEHRLDLDHSAPFYIALREVLDESAQKMMDANRIYYNYLRPHQALKGKTPAKKAGTDLKLEGE